MSALTHAAECLRDKLLLTEDEHTTRVEKLEKRHLKEVKCILAKSDLVRDEAARTERARNANEVESLIKAQKAVLDTQKACAASMKAQMTQSEAETAFKKDAEHQQMLSREQLQNGVQIKSLQDIIESYRVSPASQMYETHIAEKNMHIMQAEEKLIEASKRHEVDCLERVTRAVVEDRRLTQDVMRQLNIKLETTAYSLKDKEKQLRKSEKRLAEVKEENKDEVEEKVEEAVAEEQRLSKERMKAYSDVCVAQAALASSLHEQTKTEALMQKDMAHVNEAADTRAKADEALLALKVQNCALMQSNADLVTQHADWVKSHIYSETVLLREQSAALTHQVNMLKKTNTGKGHYGENLVLEYLKTMFTSHTFERPSLPHVCDVHMKDDQDNVIAIECKNKDKITKADLTKFYEDLDHMSERDIPCIAGVFVSVNSKSIPGKGPLTFEMYKQKPVLLLGYESESEFQTMFKEHMPAIIAVSSYHKYQNGSMQNVQDLIKKLYPSVERLRRMHGACEVLKTSSQSITHHVCSLQKDIGELSTSITSAMSDVTAPNCPITLAV